MGEYERSITINASRKQIEDFVSDFKNLPKYVPTTKSAQPQADNTKRPYEVTGHLSITPPRKVSEDMSKRAGSPDNAINDGIQKSLESIKNQLEGTGGKVDYK